MTMRKLLIIIAVGAAIPAASAEAQTITRDDFLIRLQKTHPKFKKEALTSQIEQSEKAALLGAEDWNVQSSFFFSHEQPSIAGTSPERTNAFSFAGGLTRTFWNTGARLTADFSSLHARLKIDPLWGYPSTFFENRLAVSYVHPLMRNKNGLLDRLEFELKQYDIDFSSVRADENLEGFLTTLAIKFLDWVFLDEQRDIVMRRLQLSRDELVRTKRKRESNLVDQADLIRAEDAVRFWEQNRVLVESQWKGYQAELAVIAQDQELYNLSPEFDLYALESGETLEESIGQIRDSSRLVELLRLRIEQLNQSRIGYVDISRPELSFVAELNVKEADVAFGNSMVMNKPDATVGLRFSVPLENRTAKSKIMKTDLQIVQLEKEIDDLILALESSYTNLFIQIRELEKVMELNQEQIESARERTKEELRLYNQGRGELTFVIQSRDNEQNAQLTYAQNALVYHQLIVRSEALLDQIYE